MQGGVPGLLFLLCTAANAPKETELEHQIERWLTQAFGVDIGFKVGDALTRIDRLGLLKRDAERLSVLPLDAALQKT